MEAKTVRNTNRRSLILLSIALLVTSLPSTPSSCSSDSNLKFYTINNLSCERCVQAIQPLLDLYEEQVTVYNIWEPNHTLLYNAVINFTGLERELPLIIVFKSNRLFAILFGRYRQTDWEAILATEYESVPVFYSQDFLPPGMSIIPSGIMDYITEQENIAGITDLFIQDGSDSNDVPDILTLLPLIALAAAADAVNPCEFYVLIAFLSLAFYHVGRKAVLKSGIAYSVAIFIVYFLMGIGMLKIVEHIQQFKLLIVVAFGVFGLFMGVRRMLSAFANRETKHIPDALSKRLSIDLRNISENPMTAFAIGVAAGVFLLPCTSGPYFMAVILISDLGRLLDGLILLIIYNSIVIAPFIAITLCIHTVKLKTGELKRWSSRNQRRVNFISGIAILVLSLYLFSTIEI